MDLSMTSATIDSLSIPLIKFLNDQLPLEYVMNTTEARHIRSQYRSIQVNLPSNPSPGTKISCVAYATSSPSEQPMTSITYKPRCKNFWRKNCPGFRRNFSSICTSNGSSGVFLDRLTNSFLFELLSLGHRLFRTQFPLLQESKSGCLGLTASNSTRLQVLTDGAGRHFVLRALH